MKNVLILLCCLLSGCALFNNPEHCEKADEKKLGEEYVNLGLPPDNFERFTKQCEKYKYRVPSVEKFKESYDSYTKELCTNERKYFKKAYNIYSYGSSPVDCPNLKTAKDDAYTASQYKKEIKKYDEKIKKTEDDWRNSKNDKGLQESNGLIFNTIVKNMIYTHPNSVKEDQAEVQTKLKTIANKYNYYASEL